MTENITHVTDSTFATEVLQAATPILVDFWAAWCGPCRTLAPTLEAIADEFVGKIKIAKVNVDENSETSATYNIRGIPSLLLFKKGKVVAIKVGVLTKSQLTDFLNANL